MNQFGGDWTRIKIEMLVEYARAYLTIMKGRKYFKLMYFDGFAGSGFIVSGKQENVELTVGAARRIIEIEKPRSFDRYYFVEKDAKNFQKLKRNTKDVFPAKDIIVVQEDCNKKIIDLANFLRDPGNRNYRTLAYIDPCGMQVEWRSIENLRGLPIDMWILAPTGLGVNRLLKNNGQISDTWLERLEIFLGLSRSEIEEHFYSKSDALFPDLTIVKKKQDAIEKSAKLYLKRLNEIFQFVSSPFELRNSMRSPMYHLFMASNNRNAIKIANDIIKKYNK
jgi:three-Cys-motif partner protein